MKLIETRRKAIRGVATRHGVRDIRWWPPTTSAAWLDVLVEDVPDNLADFRSDLERAVGCQVAVYLAGQIPQEAWGRILVEAVAL